LSIGTELVISRNPAWDRIINVPCVQKGDELVLSTSSGGTVTLSYEMMALKAEDGLNFEASIQSVPLASSLRLSISKCLTTSDNFQRKDRLSSGNTSMLSKLLERLKFFLAAVARDQSKSMTVVISIMVLLVGAASIPFIGPDTSLLFVFAVVLSFHNIRKLFFDTLIGDIDTENQRPSPLALVLLGHAFTSPDAPISQPDDEIPKRFIDGCEGDLREARRRWDITRRWRDSEGVNFILESKQPYFNLIKSMYPFYHAGRGREGHVVFYERPGDLESAQVRVRVSSNYVSGLYI
jgi:hypothetical protein